MTKVHLNKSKFVKQPLGYIMKSICLPVGDACGHISHRFFVHRARKRLIVQTIKSSTFSPGNSIKEKTVEIMQGQKLRDQFKLADHTNSYTVYTKLVRKKMYLAIAIEDIEMRLTVSREKSPTLGQRMVIAYNESSEEAIRLAKNDMEDAMSVTLGSLVDEHQSAWKDLAHTGIHLDPADPGKFGRKNGRSLDLSSVNCIQH